MDASGITDIADGCMGLIGIGERAGDRTRLALRKPARQAPQSAHSAIERDSIILNTVRSSDDVRKSCFVISSGCKERYDFAVRHSSFIRVYYPG